jgi:hypothetical protein
MVLFMLHGVRSQCRGTCVRGQFSYNLALEKSGGGWVDIAGDKRERIWLQQCHCVVTSVFRDIKIIRRSSRITVYGFLS